DERRLGRRELPVAQAIVDHPGAEAEAAESLVEVARRPLDEARVELAPERENPLRDRAVRRDDDDENHPRREAEDLDPGDAPARRRRWWRSPSSPRAHRTRGTSRRQSAESAAGARRTSLAGALGTLTRCFREKAPHHHHPILGTALGGAVRCLGELDLRLGVP